MKKDTVLSDFAADTLRGLSSHPKYLSSKYFYNDKGNTIFQEIMRMPEYYLTDCELEIFSTYKSDILDSFAIGKKPFELIELGAGDGLKTKILLSFLLQQKVNFKYIPIDISKKAVVNLVDDLKKQIPDLPVEGLAIDYFDLTEKLNGGKRKIILFLGSNIGNYSYEESLQFLTYLKSIMNSNDMILIGFDLKKDVELILRAYNDPHGHTAAFNLNLLQRINDELDADFNLQNFSHKEIYDEQTGEAKSYLFCQKEHEVIINTLNKKFEFKDGERIFMEISQKYDVSIIEDLAKHSGFKITRNFYDRRQFFVNSLWTVNS